MKVFVTGANGFIGSAIVRELLANGHQVLGLVRSDAGAAAVAAAGAEVHRGSLEDLDSLRSGAAASDGVIHTAFVHDFSDMAAAALTDRHAIEAIAETLVGSGRPFVITSGTPVLENSIIATEDSMPDLNSPVAGRFRNEEVLLSFVSRDVRASIVRLPRSVHGVGDKGFVPMLINTARQTGVSAYPGEGLVRWPAVHRLDTARLFRMALEIAPAGSRLHGVGDEGIPVRDIANVIGRHLNIPVASIPAEEVPARFGFVGNVLLWDCPASSTQTQQLLGWHPVEPSLIADLEQGHYFKNA